MPPDPPPRAPSTASVDTRLMLESLLESVPGMGFYASVEPPYAFRFVSAGSKELIGRTPGELTVAGAPSHDDLVHYADLGAVIAAREDAILARRSFEVRYRIRCVDGGQRWVQERGHGTWGADGRLTGLAGFIREASPPERASGSSRAPLEVLSQAFHASPEAISILEAGTGRILEVNESFERIFGWSRAEALGHTSMELRLWSDQTEREKLLARLEAEGRVLDYHASVLRKDGTRREVRTSVEPVEIGGRPCLLTIARDTTEQNLAERILRESEEKFGTAFRASPIAMSITELATGRYVDINGALERLSGYTREETVGHTSFELNLWCDPADRVALARRLRDEGSVRSMEIHFRHRSGRIIETLCNCERIEINGVDCILLAVEDVTERRRAERALRMSEEKFAKAFHSSQHSLIISEVDTGKFLEVNEGFLQIYGFTREEVIGRTVFELGIWPDPAVRLEIANELKARGSVRAREIQNIGKDGRHVSLVVSLEPIEIDGRACLLAAGTDVSPLREADVERARLEAQLRQAQKLDALGRLAGGIAHDFNNILSGILVNTDLAIMDAEHPEEVRKWLSEVRRAGQRARDLVRQILTFSRQQPQERVPQRLHSVVREALHLLRASLPTAVDIAERIDPAAPPVLADATQIHQIVMNLGINASHAMTRPPRRLTISLDNVVIDQPGDTAPAGLEPGRYARLSVSDTGTGMDEATISRIFEPFFTTKGPGEGTGLSLSVVHGIVEAHDGAITVSSHVGEGTTFDIYLPEHADLSAPPARDETLLPRGNAQRVLVVDDEESIGRGLTNILMRLGYQPAFHTDPRTAWDAFAAGDFDLVFSDVTMPYLSGIELARRILATRPDTPVILASGHAGGWTAESVRALGARTLLAKPLTATKVAHAVYAALHEPAGTPAPA